MVVGSFTEEYESSIPLERLWKAAVLDTPTLAPKLLPEIMTSVNHIEGNGGVGTVTQFNFTDVVKDYKFIKDRIDVLDHENHVFKYTVIEGGLLGSILKACSYELKLEAAAGGGSKGRLTVNYDTVGDNPLPGEEAGKLTFGIVSMTKAVEAYLQANPDAYA